MQFVNAVGDDYAEESFLATIASIFYTNNFFEANITDHLLLNMP